MIAAFGVTLYSAAEVPAKDSLNLKEIVVTGTRNATDVRYLPHTVSIINREMLDEFHRDNILPTVMERVPGMMVTSRGMMGYGVSNGAAGEITMRGISSKTGRFMVLIDGHPQYQGIFGHSIPDSYQTLMADRVEVMRGPASMMYGSNAMGGVINIVTRGMKTDGVRTDVNLAGGSWGTAKAEVSNQFRKGKFSSTIAGQYGRTDNHRPNMGFEQYGGFIKLGYDISRYWNVYADFDITHFNASNPGSVTVPMIDNDQWITRASANLVLENKYTNLATVKGMRVSTNGAISIYDNFGFHKINDGYEALNPKASPQKEFFRSKDAVSGVSIYQSATYHSFNPTTITMGMDYKNIYGRAYYTDIKTGNIIATGSRKMQSCHEHMAELAPYIDLRQEITKYVTLDMGVRLDWHSVAGTEVIPQVGVMVRPTDNTEFKATMSKGFHNPTTKDMYLYKSANHETLQAESMMNYEVSWRHHLLGNSLVYGVNLFYIKGKNMIQTINMKNVNSGKFINRGVELDCSWTINSHWSLNTNHSYLDMYSPLASAPTYKGYLAANFKTGKWSASLGVTQLCDMYLDNGKNAPKENVTLVNATINYQALKFLKLWASGENLLAQKYQIQTGYFMPRATFMAGVNMTF